MADFKAQIESSNKAVMDCFKANDMQGLSELYAEDCKLLPPGMETLHGRQGVVKALSALWEEGARSLEMVTEELEQLGEDAAYERSAYTVRKADGSVMDVGKFVVIWKKIGGSWQLYIDVNNSNKA